MNWYDVAPKGVAAMQIAWERRQSVLRMRSLGFSIRQIAERLGVCYNNALQLAAKAAKDSPKAPITHWGEMGEAWGQIDRTGDRPTRRFRGD